MPVISEKWIFFRGINFYFCTIKTHYIVCISESMEIGAGAYTPDKIEGFGIYTSLADFPLSSCPFYLKESIGAVCKSGTASIQVFDNKFRILPEMVITLLPWQLVSIKEISEDFRLTFFRVSQDMFADSLSSLWRLRPGFFFYMGKHIVSEPKEGNIRRFLSFCDLLDYRAKYVLNYPRESIMQLLRVYYWDLYVIYINDPGERKTRYTYKEELAFQFAQLIVEEHSPNKDVTDYARKLNVSPKYLTNLVHSISGKSAHDWIVHYAILEIKSLLRESCMDIKSIAARTNFPDQATLSRFFRHYTGMTPSKYRESILF